MRPPVGLARLASSLHNVSVSSSLDPPPSFPDPTVMPVPEPLTFPSTTFSLPDPSTDVYSSSHLADPTVQTGSAPEPGYMPDPASAPPYRADTGAIQTYQPPSYPPYSYPRQARTNGPGLIVGIVGAVVVVLVVACLGVVGWAGRVETSHTSGQVVPGPAEPTDDTNTLSGEEPGTHPGDLRKCLITAPASAHSLAHPLSKNGKLTLEQDAALSAHPDERATLLATYNFDTEAVTGWVTSDGTIVTVRLLRFDDLDDSLGYYYDEGDNFSKQYGEQNEDFLYGGGSLYPDLKKDDHGREGTVSITLAGDTVILIFTRKLPPVSVAYPEKLVKQQSAKLGF